MKVFFIGCFSMTLSLLSAQEFTSWSFGNLLAHSYGADDYGCGVSITDINLDGKEDFTLINAYTPSIAYIQGDSGIQAMNLPFGPQEEVRQITWVDFDNDGDRDLFMTGRNMPARLYRNNSWVFEEIGDQLGIFTDTHSYFGHAWSDYDRDGDLDVFVANYDQAYTGLTDFRNCLYRQNSEGNFDEVAEELGLVTQANYTFMGLWTDINHDLWPDLFIINDRNTSPNQLYLNNGDGTFTDISTSSHMDDAILAMTATQGDYNNDGHLDLYISNNPSGNLHKRNLGDNTFSEVAQMVGTELNLLSWSAQCTDFDCDGNEDMHVCVSPHINYPHQNQLLKNIGGFFIPYTQPSGMIPDNGRSSGSAVGDLNDDGFQDIIVAKSNPSVSQFWLSVPNENHWIKVSLRGVYSNKDGVGSWITCHKGNNRFTRFTNCGESYLAQNSFVEHFGLGSAEVLDSLVVEWPSGVRDVWRRVPTNQNLTLIEGTSSAVWVETITSSPECMQMAQQFGSSIAEAHIIWMNDDTTSTISAFVNESVHFRYIDSSGNSLYSDTVYVTMSEANFTADVIPPGCDTSELGSASLTFNGSLWTDTLILNNSNVSASFLDSLGPGFYTAEIISENSCHHTTTFSIDAFQSPKDFLSASVQHVSCHGGSDGIITITSDSALTMDWALTDNNQNTHSLTAGEYVLIAIDSSGCADTLSFFVSEPDPLLMAVNIYNNEGNGNYNVTLNVTGGVPPYSYSIDGYAATGNGDVNMPPGEHFIQVIDDNACMTDTTIYLDFAVSLLHDNAHFNYRNRHLFIHQAGLYALYDFSGRLLQYCRCDAQDCSIEIYLPKGLYVIRDFNRKERPVKFSVIHN